MNLKNKLNGIKEIWKFENRWHLLFNRIFFSKEKINIYRYKNFEILIDHSAGDANGAREILATDMYRQFLRKMNLADPINVLDLGANNGGFPILLESEKIRIKKLVSVEFNPKTFSRMRFNIERNLKCEFYPVNKALTGEAREFEIGFGKTGTSDSLYRNDSSGARFRIQGLTFDQIYREFFNNKVIDVCKIDVEGAEFEVFENEEYKELRNIKNLLIEIHHEKETPRKFVQKKIHDLGFDEIEKENKTDEFHYVHLFVNKKF